MQTFFEDVARFFAWLMDNKGSHNIAGWLGSLRELLLLLLLLLNGTLSHFRLANHFKSAVETAITSARLQRFRLFLLIFFI